jgi:hypothetical protein
MGAAIAAQTRWREQGGFSKAGILLAIYRVGYVCSHSIRQELLTGFSAPPHGCMKHVTMHCGYVNGKRVLGTQYL